jgi:circadian clock protein KaiB
MKRTRPNNSNGNGKIASNGNGRIASKGNGKIASNGNGKPVHHLFRLFVAGDGANSQLALTNLRSLCGEHLKGRFKIEEVDVVKDFKAAVKHNILVTPALLLITPIPRVIILGNLSDRPKVMLALRLNGVHS